MEEASVPVPLIASALGGDRDLASGRFTEFCLVIRSQDFDLFDRVGVQGDVSSTIVAGVDVRSTVNGELALVRARAVYVVRVISSGARTMPVEQPSAARSPRNQLHVIEDIPPVHGNVVQLLGSNQVGPFTRTGLQLNLAGVGAHRHGFGGGANLNNQFADI